MIFEKSPLEAWIAASNHLINKGGQCTNLLVSFPSGPARDERPLDKYDPRKILGARYDRARDVANTIFPSKTARNTKTRAELYKRYMKAHSRGRKKGWGTYFLRQISFGSKEVNQLERLIEAMNRWPKKAYSAAFHMHLSSAETDNLRPLGGPCLQYVQFNCPSIAQIDLVAVYRNHDFCNKVLGNYFGLSRLLHYVSKETDRDPGKVSCLSIHAYIGTSLKNQKHLIGLV
jgi:thymidylate synthase